MEGLYASTDAVSSCNNAFWFLDVVTPRESAQNIVTQRHAFSRAMHHSWYLKPLTKFIESKMTWGPFGLRYLSTVDCSVWRVIFSIRASLYALFRFRLKEGSSTRMHSSPASSSRRWMSFATSDLFDFGSPVKIIKHDGGLFDIPLLLLRRCYIPSSFYYSLFILFDALVIIFSELKSM